MTTQRVDALLFDLGRVVMNIEFDRTLAVWAHHSDSDPEILRQRFSEDAAYRAHEVGRIEAADYFDSLRRSLGVDMTDEQWLEGWNALFAGEMPGISALLAELASRLPLFAFSNTNRAHIAYWPGRFDDVLSHFNQVFVSPDIGLRKPDVAAFRHVAAEMGVTPANVLFFDDVVENIDGAIRTGMQAVHVTTPQCVAEAVGLRFGLK